MKYKGYELLKAIADGEIKEGSRFKTEEREEIEWNGLNLLFTNTRKCYLRQIADINFINNTFELIEDEIDIDSIEEYKQEHTERCIDVDVRNKINELVQAVKQLNKKVKGI